MSICRFLIVIIWLAVPVTAFGLVQLDHERFSDKSVEQRAECQGREDAIRRYSRLLSLRTGQIHNITNADTRADWQAQFSEITRDMTNELTGLRARTPVHYPRTDLHLLDLEKSLNRQVEAIEDAARNRTAYVHAGRDLEDKARNIQTGRDTANYYRSIGAASIAEMIDDDVDIRERELRRQLTERNRRVELIREALDNADYYYQNIRKNLTLTADYLTADEEITYKMDLQRRFSEFDLRGEFARLVGLPEVSEYSKQDNSSALDRGNWLATGITRAADTLFRVTTGIHRAGGYTPRPYHSRSSARAYPS